MKLDWTKIHNYKFGSYNREQTSNENTNSDDQYDLSRPLKQAAREVNETQNEEEAKKSLPPSEEQKSIFLFDDVEELPFEVPNEIWYDAR